MTLAARRLLAAAFVFLVSSGALAAAGGRHVLVRFATPPTALDRAELAAKGLAIQRPVAGGRFVAIARGDVRDPRIASIEAFTPDHKLHPSAIREVARGKAFAALDVVFHDEVTLDDALAAIAEAGGAPADPLAVTFAFGKRVRAQLPTSALQRLARDERVMTIVARIQPKVRRENAISAALSHVTNVQSAPYGLTGSGVTLSLFELGQAQASHPDFGGRLTTHTSDVIDSHATHVAGTIGGSGAGSTQGQARGMAPGSLIHQFQVDEGVNGNDITLAMKETQLAPLGVVADNNSWGYVLTWDYNGQWIWPDLEQYLGAYDLLYAAPLDRIAIEQNILFVHSAGNDAQQPVLAWPGLHRHGYESTINWCFSQAGTGTDCPAPCSVGYCETTTHMALAPWLTIGSMESAKNILLVGAVDNDKLLAYFSSRGPARDGRVKPELVARGIGVISTTPYNSYGTKSGTSMAAPVVTGIAGLIAQQWRQTFGGISPTVAQLRTLLIAGAEDLGNVGPDYAYGYGLVDAKASADLIRAGDRIRNGALDQGQSLEYFVTLSQPQPLRVVVGWSDPDIVYLGGSDIAEPALVNDIDVTVIDAQGNITRPYVLDKNAPAAAATRGANHVDNLEMIEIPNAGAGTYRVVVTATNIADAAPQTFVLVANAQTATAGASFALTATGSASSVALNWSSAASGATYDVYARSGSGPLALRAAGLNATSYVDGGVTSDTAYLYRVLAHLPGNGLAWSSLDLATTIDFDPTLGQGQPIRFVHIDQLAAAANRVRTLAGLGAMTWTNPPAPLGFVRALQIQELRSALTAARTVLALPPLSFRAIGGGSTILAADFTEIRDALQ